MNYKFLDALEVSPVIAAVKDDEGVEACLKSESQVVFILYGDICTMETGGSTSRLDPWTGIEEYRCRFYQKIYRSRRCDLYKTDDHSSSEGTWNAHGIARIFD